MISRDALGAVLGFAFVTVVGAVSCNSSSAVGLDHGCSINSDCASQLVCAFGRCHDQCKASRDCPSGQRCIVSTSAGVCQLAQETSCANGSLCQSGEVCGADQQCRVQCTASGGCVAGDYCLTSGVSGACYSSTSSGDESALIAAGILPADGATIGDASSAALGPDSSAGSNGPDGSNGADVASGGDGGDATVASGGQCSSAQTQFGLIAQGDSNPGFTSSVGVRTATQLLVFSGYNGPDPSADGGTSDGGGGKVNLIYWQAFDPTTAKSLGPAQPLVLTDSTSVGYIYLDDVSIAPTGEIAVLYTHIDPVKVGGQLGADGLSVAFLAPTADAGSQAPQVQQNVQIESAQVSYPAKLGQPEGQPHAIWSTFSNAFVFSWNYTMGYPHVRVRKFLANGAAAGGDTNIVPTNDPMANAAYESGSVGTSGALLGVAVIPYSGGGPSLTVLDALGNEVGSSLQVTNQAESGNEGGGYYYWNATAGTANGFVYFAGTRPVSEYFVPTTPDGGAAAVTDGAIATLVGGAPLPGFSVTGTEPAVIGRAISDDTGGPGGVGAVLLYADGADFIYVNADGVTHLGPTTVISHAFGGADEVAITEFGGSFGISLYSAAEHLTRMAASGCVH